MSQPIFDVKQLQLHHDKLMAQGIDGYDLRAVAAAVQRPYATLLINDNPSAGREVAIPGPGGGRSVRIVIPRSRPDFGELVRGCLKQYSIFSMRVLREHFESWDTQRKRLAIRRQYPMWPANNYNPDEIAQLGHA